MLFFNRDYWENRRAEEGDSYVAKGGSQEVADEQFVELLPVLQGIVPRGGKTLDFGCGPGRFKSFLEGISGGRYDGVDVIRGLGTMEIEEELPTGYDVAVAIMVIQHIADDEAYEHWVGQLFACLKPGGTLIVVDHVEISKPDHHMRPRGWERILGHSECYGFEHTPGYDNHWCGLFRKDEVKLEPGPIPTFKEKEGKIHLISEMPTILAITTELLETGLPAAIRREGDDIVIDVVEGKWIYEIAGWRAKGTECVAQLVAGPA